MQNTENIYAKKSLGQNFLVNEKIYRQIVAALEVKPSDTVIEVGPGLGTLTDFLIEAGARIIAVEKDDTLAEYLKNKYDAVSFQISEIAPER